MDDLAYQGKSLIKTTWDELSHILSRIDPVFVKCVNELSPGKEFPLYLAYYRYGDMIGDTETTYIPAEDGSLMRLNDPSLPADIVKDLGYGRQSAPFLMILDKVMELRAYDTEDPLLVRLREPGFLGPGFYILDGFQPSIYSSNKVTVAYAGARSACMLPSIGESLRHEHLKTTFRLKRDPAKDLHEHGVLFKDIVNAPRANCNWRSCILYFSETWIRHILEDKVWSGVKEYLMRYFLEGSALSRYRTQYDIVFSLIQKQKNLKQNPYFLDTAKHLLNIASGSMPCFVPATTENGLPLKILQDVFMNVYRLDYIPTVMEPAYLNLDQDVFGGYYPLQYPSVLDFTPSSRKAGILANLREIELICMKLQEALVKPGNPLESTPLGLAAKKLKLEYYHNQVDPQWGNSLSAKIPDLDPRFSFLSPGLLLSKNPGVATEAPFMRGCIRLLGSH